MADYVFDFSLISVGELDKGMNASRFSDVTRKLIAKTTGTDEKELATMKVPEYKKLVARFVKAAYDPVAIDPN